MGFQITNVFNFTSTNWDSAQTIIVSQTDDGNTVDEATTITSTATGGGYAGITANVIVNVKDNDEVNIDVSTTNIAVEEGTSASYQILLLGVAPTANVVIEITSSNSEVATTTPSVLTFTPDNWDVVRTVVINTMQLATINNTSSQLTHTATSQDANYTGLSISQVSVNVINIDSAVSASVSTVAIIDNAAFSYEVRLASKPSADVTLTTISDDNSLIEITTGGLLTFNTANWSALQTITIIAPADANFVNEFATVTSTATGGGYAGLSVSVNVNIEDSEKPISSNITNNSIRMDLGDTIDYELALTVKPSADVVITLTSNDISIAIAIPDMLTFTSSNWDTTQTIVVSGTIAEATSAEFASARFTLLEHAVFSADARYNGFQIANIDVRIDNVEPAIRVQAFFGPLAGDDPYLPEAVVGGIYSYGISLATQPSSNVVVTIVNGDIGAINVGTGSIFTFSPSNWNKNTTHGLSSLSDNDTNDEIVTIRYSASGGDYEGVIFDWVVRVVDDDTVTIIPDFGVAITTGVVSDNIIIDEGATFAYTVKLLNAPTADVIVEAFASNEVAATDFDFIDLVPDVLTFTAANWDESRTIMLSTRAEPLSVEDRLVQISYRTFSTDANYHNLRSSDIIVDIINIERGIRTTKSALSIKEQGVLESYYISLATMPSGEVIVATTSADSTKVSAYATTQVSTFTPDNWAQQQLVLLTASADDNDIDETIIITNTADSSYGNVSSMVVVTIEDDDQVSLTVDATTIEIAENTTFGYTIVLDIVPSEDVIIEVLSDNPEVIVVISSLIFSTTNWNIPQTVIIASGPVGPAGVNAQLSHEVHSADINYDGFAVNTIDVLVVNTDKSIMVSIVTANLEEGILEETYLVNLTTRPSADVVVTTTVNNPAVVVAVGGVLTFSVSNWNEQQAIIINAVEDSNAVNEVVIVVSEATGGDYAGISALITVNVTDNDVLLNLSNYSIRINEGNFVPYTIALNNQPREDVIVSISATDPSYVAIIPNIVTFTPANWNLTQTISVYGLVFVEVSDRQTEFLHTVSSVDSDYNNAVVDNIIVDIVNNGITIPATINVGEKTSTGYAITLASAPSDDVVVTSVSDDINILVISVGSVLTFTPDNWDTSQTISVTPVEDLNAINETVTIVSTAGINYSDSSATIIATIIDSDVAGVVTVDGFRVDEGSSAVYAVALTSEPIQDVVIDIVVSNLNFASVTVDSLIFTQDNWHIEQTVTVHSVMFADFAHRNVNIAHTLTSQDAGYNNLTHNISVDIINLNNAILSSTTRIVLTEGSFALSYSIVLASEPDSDVVITTTSNDETVAVVIVGGMSTFTPDNWDISQIITVNPVDDEDNLNGGTFITSVADGNYDDLIISITATVVVDD